VPQAAIDAPRDQPGGRRWQLDQAARCTRARYMSYSCSAARLVPCSPTGRPPGAQEGADVKAKVKVKVADALLDAKAWEHPC
jgi:hypothetical protein